MLGDTPLGRPVLGTVDTINALTRDQVAGFYRKHYDPDPPGGRRGGQPRPRRASYARSARAFERAGALRDPAAVPQPPRGGPGAAHRRAGSRCLDRRTEQAHLVLGMPGLTRTDERRWALGVLNTALGGGMSSRLFQEVREKRGLAYSVYSYTSSFADCGLVRRLRGLPAESRVREVLTICRDELAQVAEHGLSDEELRRAHRPAVRRHRAGPGGYRRADEPASARASCAGATICPWTTCSARIAAVTPDEVRRSPATCWGQRPSLAVIGPLKDKQAARLHEAVA